jgi:hypothetical protein
MTVLLLIKRVVESQGDIIFKAQLWLHSWAGEVKYFWMEQVSERATMHQQTQPRGLVGFSWFFEVWTLWTSKNHQKPAKPLVKFPDVQVHTAGDHGWRPIPECAPLAATRFFA